MFSLIKTKQQNHKPLVICGPSGVGKGTLIKNLMSAEPDSFGFSVSHTTRGMRPKEEDGVDYNFVSHDEFLQLIHDDAFIEHLQYNNNRYGTSKQALQKVQQQGRLCILDIAISSAQKIKNMPDLECNFLFITTSGGLTTLEKRLRGRMTEKEEQIAGRLQAGQKELQFVEQNPQFFNSVLINDELSEALQNLRNIVHKWYWLSDYDDSFPELPPEELNSNCTELHDNFQKISLESNIDSDSSDSNSDEQTLSSNESSGISTTNETASPGVVAHSPELKMSASKYKDVFIYEVNVLGHYLTLAAKAESIWSFNLMLKSFTLLYVYSDIFVL